MLDDMSDLPAGPVLDRLIAEGPMGWHLNPDNSDPARGIFCYNSGFIVRPTRWDMRDWCPSTRPEQALQVVEHMASQKHDWQIRHNCYGSEALVTGNDSWSQATTLALAICRAALTAHQRDPN
jgi:hypothetical protein